MSRQFAQETPRKKALFTLPLIVVTLLVCETPTIGQEGSTPPRPDVTRTIEHDGVQRTYHVHLPPRFGVAKKLRPAVLGLHGGGGSGRRFAKGSTGGTLLRASEKRDVVLILPEGLNGHWNDGRTEVFRGRKGPDDVGFLRKVIDDAVRTFHLDPRRIFATGISNGGFMSLRLAVDLSERIAAVAPVAAQMTPVLAARKPKRPVSILFMCGTKDPIVPYGGGVVRVHPFGRGRGRVLSVADSVSYWRSIDACKSPPRVQHLKDKNPKDGTTVEVFRYASGRNGSEVVLFKVIGGGHAWPGRGRERSRLKRRLVGRASTEIDAGAVILDFLLAHARTRSATPRKARTDSGRPSRR